MSCTHQDTIDFTDPPDWIEGCEDCLATGGRWVHLRMCQSCGKVGCCDSSPNRHASKHARGEGHPYPAFDRAGRGWELVRDRRGDAPSWPRDEPSRRVGGTEEAL